MICSLYIILSISYRLYQLISSPLTKNLYKPNVSILMVVMIANVLMDTKVMAFNAMMSMSAIIQEDHQNVEMVVFVSIVKVPSFVSVPSAMHSKVGIHGPLDFSLSAWPSGNGVSLFEDGNFDPWILFSR